MKIRRIKVRPYFRILKSDLLGLTENDLVIIRTDLDDFEYTVRVKNIIDRYERGIGSKSGKPNVHWDSNVEGVSASAGVPKWMKDIALLEAPLQEIKRTWIFQGNPDSFRMDDYLAEADGEITWRVKRNKGKVSIGDEVYLWRAQGRLGNSKPGIIARATISSEVFLDSRKLNASKYWIDDGKKDEIVDRVWLKLAEVHRNVGMLEKEVLKENPKLENMIILKSPQGTTFPLSEEESYEIERLWKIYTNWDNTDSTLSSRGNEFPRKRKSDRFDFERSQWVVDQTLIRAKFLCEVPACQVPLFDKMDGSKYLEVHHLITLASGGPDTLDNTVCLCPHHHREIHFGSNAVVLTSQLKKARAQS